jgi:cytochrome c oxidase subunit 2
MEQFLGLYPDASAHGPALDHLIVLVHWLMLVLFVGWGAFFIITLFRFRKSRRPQASYTGVTSHSSTYIEAGVLVAEIILLAAFSIPLWSKRVDAFPSENEAVVVRVVAEQFAWNVHYPGPDGKFGRTSIGLIDTDNPLGLDRSDPDAKDDIVTNNNLFLPVNKPVIVRLSTKDVIHSFNLTAFRVKQDAIPGMEIPVWFTPTKTTAEVREELRRSWSVADAMKKVRTVKLPALGHTAIAKGWHDDNLMLMQDVSDSTGTIASKGDHLTADNVDKLADAGMKDAPTRQAANLDKYVSMEEHKDTSGSPMISKNDALTEDAVTKLVEAGVHELTARQVSNMDAFMVMENYSDKSGSVVASKGDALSEDVLTKLADAGVMEVVIAPATPTEIACAQLCGLGHFRMRGYMTVQTPEEFKAWYDEQEAALAPPADTSQPASADSSQSAPSTPPGTGKAAKKAAPNKPGTKPGQKPGLKI